MRDRIRTFVAALATAATLAAQGGPVPAGDRPPVRGTLETRDGIDVLRLEGDLEEQGFAEGWLAGERIRALFRGFALSPRIVPKPGLWNLVVVPRARQRLVFPDWVRPWCAAVLAGIEARDPDLLEIPELNRDLTVDDLLACAALPDFVGLACSSFVAWGDRIEGPGPLVARNLDYFATDELLRQTMVVVRGPRDGRAGWVSIGWPGIAGCLTGISDRGVAAAIHDVPARALPDTRVTPRGIALQELIETFAPGRAPAAEAAAVLRGFRYGMGGNLLVGWRGHGDLCGAGGAVFEVWPARDPAAGVTVRGPDDGRTFVVSSNHHRARVQPERECWRYAALFDGLAEDDARLDFAGAAALIRKSEVEATLYQVTTDLGTGTLALRFRRAPRQDRWQEVGAWNVAELLAAPSRQGR